MVPRPTGQPPFEEIARDFIVDLPESEACNAILVVRDRFANVQHYLPANTTGTGADIANAYINEMWRIDRLSSHITCGRGTQFASKFSQQFKLKPNINLCPSTTYHPQTVEVC